MIVRISGSIYVFVLILVFLLVRFIHMYEKCIANKSYRWKPGRGDLEMNVARRWEAAPFKIPFFWPSNLFSPSYTCIIPSECNRDYKRNLGAEEFIVQGKLEPKNEKNTWSIFVFSDAIFCLFGFFSRLLVFFLGPIVPLATECLFFLSISETMQHILDHHHGIKSSWRSLQRPFPGKLPF